MAITLSQTETPEITAPDPQRIDPPELASDPSAMFGMEAPDWRDDHQKAMDAWREQSASALDAALLDPNAYTDERIPTGWTPDEWRKTRAVDDWMRLHSDGEEPPLDGHQREFTRALLAERHFGGQGAASDEALFTEITGQATLRRDRQTLARTLVGAAVTDAALPSDKAPGFSAWLKQAPGKPGFDPERVGDYAQAFTEARREAKEREEPIADVLRKSWQAFRTGIEGGIPAAEIAELSREDFTLLLESLRARAEALPDEAKEDFIAGMRKDFLRSVEGFYRNAVETAGDLALRADMPTRPPDERRDPLTRGEREEFQAARADAADANTLARGRAAEVRRIMQADYDPIDYTKGFKWLQMAPGVTMTSLTMAVPGAGTPVMAASLMGGAQERAYLKAIDSGMDEDAAGRYAATIAPAVTVPQVILEKAGYSIWARKLPLFDKVLTKLDDAIVNRGLRMLTKTAAITAAETAIEVSQDLTETAIQDLANALNADLPDVDWGTELQGTWNSIPEIAGSMLFLSIFGAAGGLNREARINAFASASDLELRAAGINAEGIARIRAAAATGQGSANATITEEWQKRQKDSKDAKAAAEEAALKARIQAGAAMAMRASGDMPIIERSKNGFRVLDGKTGEEIGTAEQPQAAFQIARAHSDYMNEQDREWMQFMATYLEGMDAAQALDPEAINRIELGTHWLEWITEAGNDKHLSRLLAQAKDQELAGSGEDFWNAEINGFSATEFRDNVRTTINRTLMGGNLMTSVHEIGHGARRKAYAKGRMTRAEEIKMYRAIDAVVAGKTKRQPGVDAQGNPVEIKRKAGTDAKGKPVMVRMALIPEEYTDDATIPNRILDEAFSELLEMELLRSRAGGTMRKMPQRAGVLKMPSGVLTRHLNALVKMAGPEVVGKFSAFMDALRTHMKAALPRMILLKKAEREGKFDADSYDAFLAKMLGLDVQDDFNRQTEQEAARIADPLSPAAFAAALNPDYDPDADEIPFSLRYPSFPLSQFGAVPYSQSNTGVLFPDGHEIDTRQNQAPAQIPDGGGAFWERLSQDGRHAAVSGAWQAYEGRGMAEDWIQAALLEPGTNPGDTRVSGFWIWLRDTLNSEPFQGIDPVDTLDALVDIFQLDGYQSERSGSPDRLHYVPIAPDGSVLALRNDTGQAQFARLPQAGQTELSFSLGRAAVTPTASTRALDAEYLELAKDPEKNAERLREMVDAQMAAKGYIPGIEGKLAHSAPNAESASEDGRSGVVSLANLKNSDLVPADYWTRPDWYMSEATERESHRQIMRAMDGKRIRVYRTIPKAAKDTMIRNGDWVTPSREYAVESGYDENAPTKVISTMASPEQLFWDGNSANELGFDDGRSYAYKNTKNNKKRTDLVTYQYDEDGNPSIIPLSKRGNQREVSVSFSLGTAHPMLKVPSKPLEGSKFDGLPSVSSNPKSTTVDQAFENLDQIFAAVGSPLASKAAWATFVRAVSGALKEADQVAKLAKFTVLSLKKAIKTSREQESLAANLSIMEKMAAELRAEDAFLMPPDRAMEYHKDRGLDFVTDDLKRHPEFLEAREQGLADATEMLRKFRSGELGKADLAGLFVWGLLSRGVGAYYQEGGYMTLHAAGLLENLDAVFAGTMTTEELGAWAESVLDRESAETPGTSTTHNAMKIGEQLKALTTVIDGKPAIDTLLENWKSDMTGPQLRRSIYRMFTSDRPALQIQNKVLSFIILVSGRPDVMVLDRIQFRHMWGGPQVDKALGGLVKQIRKAKKIARARYKEYEKRLRAQQLPDEMESDKSMPIFLAMALHEYAHEKDLLDLAEQVSEEDLNLYDGLPDFTESGAFKYGTRGGKPLIASQGLAGVGNGIHGLAIYEALESALTEAVRNAYMAKGISFPGIGAFHWDSWLVTSQQAISHPTLALVGKLEQSPAMGVQQGKFNLIDYGMIFRYDGQYMRELLTSPGKYVMFSHAALKANFTPAKIGKALNTKINLTNNADGTTRNRPWTDDLTAEQRAKFDAYLLTFGSAVAPAPEAGADSGANGGGGSRPVHRTDATHRELIRRTGYSIDYRPGIGKGQGGSSADVARGNLSAKEFVAIAGKNKAGHKFGSSVDVYAANDYAGYDLLVVRDGEHTATASISPDGEIGAVTKSPGGSAELVETVFQAAIATGNVAWLNCYDTVLPGMYADKGFSAIARIKQDPSQRPPDYVEKDYAKFNNGSPDLVFMRFTGTPVEYRETDGPYITDWDVGVAAAKAFRPPVIRGAGPGIESAGFSLAPSRALDLMRMNALDRVRNPRRRAEIFQKISREFERLKLDAERFELIAGSKRLRKSLAKEAAMREAKAREDFENDVYARHWELLSDEDLVKIKSQPLHAYLADPASPLRGRLMSRSAAMKHRAELFGADYKGGEWDGSDGLSRSLFGGSLTPDQAAQELYDAGLIADPYVDTMWEKLHSEQAQVSAMKERLAQVQQELRAARTAAKEEANAWLRHAQGNQDVNYSPKQEILRALASMQAILRALPPPVRARIGGIMEIARAGSEEARLKILKETIAKADQELDRWMRATLDREFRALLDKTRPERDEAGKRPKGKIGANVHDLFRSIEAAMFFDADETEAEATRLETLAEAERTTPEQAAHLTMEANLVRLVGNWSKADAARREMALAEASSAYAGGYLQAQIKAAQKRERITRRRADLKQDTGKAGDRMERVQAELQNRGTKLGRTKEALLAIFSFDQMLGLVFGERSDTARTFAEWELRAANAKEDAIQRTHNAVEELLNDLAGNPLAGEKLRWKLSTERSVEWTDWKGRKQTATEMEALSYTLWWAQEDGKRHMEGLITENPDGSTTVESDWHWRAEDVAALERQLSKEAKAIRLHLRENYAAEYDRINAVFSDLYGVNMPRHKDYSPISVAPSHSPGGQMADPVSGTMQGPGLTPGSLKNRSHSAVAEPQRMDALQHYVAHVKQMEHFIAYAPLASELMAIVNHRDLGNSIEAAAGKEALNILRSWTDYFAQGGTRDAAAHLAVSGWFQRGLDRISQMALVGRVSVLAVQSVQLGAAAYQMPVASYLKRLAKLSTGQLGWGKAIRSDYIQRRLAQMPPAVQQAMQGLASGKPSRIKHATARLGQLISGADALFTAGTYAIIQDYQMVIAKDRGIPNPEAYAEQEAIRLTDQVAQPMRAGARSLIEVTATSPAFRMMWAFASEPRQKIALSAYGMMQKQGMERFRAAAITWTVSGLLAAVVRAAVRDLRDDGEDDEVFDEKNWDPTRLALMALSGPVGGLPIVGDVIEASIYAGAGEYLPNGGLLSGPVNAVKTAKKLATGGTEWETAIKDAESLLGGIGVAAPTAAAAASWSHIARDLEALYRNFTEN